MTMSDVFGEDPWGASSGERRFGGAARNAAGDQPRLRRPLGAAHAHRDGEVEFLYVVTRGRGLCPEDALMRTEGGSTAT